MPTARWMKNPATRARSGSAVTTVPSTRGRSRRVSPAIWAAIITAVRAVVATTPKSAQPAQSISAPTGPVGLGCGAGEQVGQGDRRVGEAVRVDAGAASDEGLDVVTLVPDVGVHAGQHSPVLEPESQELPPLPVAADHDAVPVVGVAVVLHSQVVLVGVEVRKLLVCRVLA